MADNSLQTGSDNIATDDLATLNGGAVSNVKAQRTKTGWGVDSDFKDVTPTTPLPVTVGAYQTNITGNLTAAQATAGTTVAGGTVTASDLRGIGSATIQISGTYAGVTLIIETSIDGTNWVALPFINIGTVNPTPVTSVAPGTNAVAIYNVGPLLGVAYLRVRASAWTSGSAAIIIDLSAQAYSPQVQANVTNQVTLATGSNVIGAAYAFGRTTGGATTFTLLSAATTNATLVATGAHTLYSLTISNTTTTVAYFKLYNNSTAPTVGTTVPVMTIYLPVSSTVSINLPPQGLAFGTGLAYAITGLSTTADTTAVAANAIIANGSYI